MNDNGDDRASILDEAHATLQRLKDEQAPLVEPPSVDPVERWKQDADVATARRERMQAQLARQSRPAFDWSAIDERIEQACGQLAATIVRELSERTNNDYEDLLALRAEMRDLKGKIDAQNTEARRMQLAIERQQLASDGTRDTVVSLQSQVRTLEVELARGAAVAAELRTRIAELGVTLSVGAAGWSGMPGTRN